MTVCEVCSGGWERDDLKFCPRCACNFQIPTQHYLLMHMRRLWNESGGDPAKYRHLMLTTPPPGM